MSNMKGVELLKVPLEMIKLETDNFSEGKLIAKGGFGNVYFGNLYLSGQLRAVAIKKLVPHLGQGGREFLMEIQTLSVYKHKNIVSLFGYCDEDEEKILIYEYAEHGSLDRHLSGTQLSWLQRVQICLGAARGFNYLHNDVGPHHRIVHRDIKSANILLGDNWEPLISDFGMSKLSPSNVEHMSYLYTGACGTRCYIDPQYLNTNVLTKESDVYSFGVVLFEILCGKLVNKIIEQYQDEGRSLDSLVEKYMKEDRLKEMIHANLKDEINPESLKMFSKIAHQCVRYERCDRPTMGSIIKELEKALELQASGRLARLIQLGTWGRQTKGPRDIWSFELVEDHKIRKIVIDHGDIIYSLKVTCSSGGVMQVSNDFGGSAQGDTISQVTFDDDEKILGISGTIGTRDGLEMISSLSFKTSKRLHGPFGMETKTGFFLPWEDGSFKGLYGYADQYINNIGVYLKPREEIMRVGPWGRNDVIDPPPKYCWSFELKTNHRLTMISVDHDSTVISLMFTSEHKSVLQFSKRAGGASGNPVTEIKFDWNEEICGISGTLMQRIDNNPEDKIMSSLSFVTNKRTYGPFGAIKETPFALSWDKCSFVGFYGICGGWVDSIGVYLRV